EGVAALHGHTERGYVADVDRVVLRGLRRLGEGEADLLGVDVERGDELHVVHVVVAEHDVHETRDRARRVGVLVVLDALDQRRRTVADAHDCYSYRTHGGCSFLAVFQVVASAAGAALVMVSSVEGAAGGTSTDRSVVR